MFQRIVKSAKRRLGVRPRFDPDAPFGDVVRAPRERYAQLFEDARQRNFPAVDTFLARYSNQVDIAWMHELALHTQVVVKQSDLNFQHGRILYAVLRDLLVRSPETEHFTVFETGTSRGFSIICMARAMMDANRDGKLVTIDMIGHNRRHLWNCIDDHDGPKTREELLERWAAERDRVVFLSGNSATLLDSVGLGRIHFAFLDGSHHKEDVLREYAYVAQRQAVGDMIVFDDVTPGVFDGIVDAVEMIERDVRYRVELLRAEERRGYAIATRTR